MRLENKIAVVTGASSGIGIEFSKKLAAKGALVYGLARRLNKLQEIQNEIGSTFIPVEMDITKYVDIQEWVNKTFSDNHLPHILINNAGLGYFGNVENLSVDDWNTMINTNLNGVFYLTREIVPLMKKNEDHCHIINIASVAGLLGNPQISGYNATKFGLRGFSEALFKELRYNAIKVSTMFPGSIATHFFDNAEGSDTHANMLQPSDVADTLIHLLETPDNFLINEITLRPLNPKDPEDL
ncbi:MAG: SDR family NAD(P)-dependent oxidoreductase [Balneolaceae bacterium]|nr:MAG: SDR family NAD(P)-dependent oxidoreductase [Balneolaceae bacterium]